MIKNTGTLYNGLKSRLSGEGVQKSSRLISDIYDIFEKGHLLTEAELKQTAYEVEIHDVADEAEGGLLFGISHLSPGKVGDEYFMTKGHFHEIKNRAEYYWGLKGEGLLLLMDQERNSWAEKVKPGSLHYIPGFIAHRLINTGGEVLSVGACWPSDAGHDYKTIQESGFSARVIEKDGVPALVDVSR